MNVTKIRLYWTAQDFTRASRVHNRTAVSGERSYSCARAHETTRRMVGTVTGRYRTDGRDARGDVGRAPGRELHAVTRTAAAPRAQPRDRPRTSGNRSRHGRSDRTT